MLVKLKNFSKVVWSDICDTYQRIKIFLLAILAAIIYFEWQKIKEYLLLKSGQKEIDNSKKEDQKLSSQEEASNQQANALQKKAENEPSPGDDWYKK
jgi:hypothetical protein